MKIYSYNFRVRYSTTFSNGYHRAEVVADSRVEAIEKAQKYMSELSAEHDGVFSVCHPTMAVKMNLEIKTYQFRFKKWYYMRKKWYYRCKNFPEHGIVYAVSKDDAITNAVNIYGRHNIYISTFTEIDKHTTTDFVTPIQKQVEQLNSKINY